MEKKFEQMEHFEKEDWCRKKISSYRQMLDKDQDATAPNGVSCSDCEHHGEICGYSLIPERVDHLLERVRFKCDSYRYDYKEAKLREDRDRQEAKLREDRDRQEAKFREDLERHLL